MFVILVGSNLKIETEQWSIFIEIDFRFIHDTYLR